MSSIAEHAFAQIQGTSRNNGNMYKHLCFDTVDDDRTQISFKMGGFDISETGCEEFDARCDAWKNDIVSCLANCLEEDIVFDAPEFWEMGRSEEEGSMQCWIEFRCQLRSIECAIAEGIIDPI